MDKSKLDANTREQLHELEQDADIAMLVEAHNEVIARIKELEEARIVQRGINHSLIESKEPEVKKSFWEHIISKLSN